MSRFVHRSLLLTVGLCAAGVSGVWAQNNIIVDPNELFIPETPGVVIDRDTAVLLDRSPNSLAERSPLPIRDLRFEHAGQVQAGGATLQVLDISGDMAIDPKYFLSGFWGTDAGGKTLLDLGIVEFSVQGTKLRFLASDNINATADNTESGSISIIETEFALAVRLTDALQVTFEGALVILPFRGEIGIDGFGLVDPLAKIDPSFDGRLAVRSLARFQLLYSGNVGDFDYEAVNDARALLPDNEGLAARYSISDSGLLNAWDPLAFEEIDQTGRYSFSRQSGARANLADDEFEVVTDRESTPTTDDIYYENLTGATVSTLVPSQTRISLSAYNLFTWYSDDSEEKQIYGGRVAVVNEHENWRFRPFVVYEYEADKDREEARERFSVGLRSELTENIDLIASYAWIKEFDAPATDLFRLGIRHVVGPYTLHSFNWYRDMQDYVLTDGWDYRIVQSLGPRLDLSLSLDQQDSSLAGPFISSSRRHEESYVARLTYTFLSDSSLYFEVERQLQKTINPTNTVSIASDEVEVGYSAALFSEAYYTILYRHLRYDSNGTQSDFNENYLLLELGYRF